MKEKKNVELARLRRIEDKKDLFVQRSFSNKVRACPPSHRDLSPMHNFFFYYVKQMTTKKPESSSVVVSLPKNLSDIHRVVASQMPFVWIKIFNFIDSNSNLRQTVKTATPFAFQQFEGDGVGVCIERAYGAKDNDDAYETSIESHRLPSVRRFDAHTQIHILIVVGNVCAWRIPIFFPVSIHLCTRRTHTGNHAQT